jgi:hypothetical protein
VRPATDHSRFPGIHQAATALLEIGGAVLLHYLICRWLKVRRDLAGVPR